MTVIIIRAKIAPAREDYKHFKQYNILKLLIYFQSLITDYNLYSTFIVQIRVDMSVFNKSKIYGKHLEMNYSNLKNKCYSSKL